MRVETVNSRGRKALATNPMFGQAGSYSVNQQGEIRVSLSFAGRTETRLVLEGASEARMLISLLASAMEKLGDR